ncbi:MAG TPA: OmpH family outer membrane protein [Gemmataceae bacterium]|nr:OmpH family outer membrane protein [Gemmataceae bacterium]
MKKTLASFAGLTVLGGFVVWAGWAAAQQPQTPIRQTSGTTTTNTAAAPASAQRPGTAVAVVNMNSVLKNYQKAQQLNTQIKNKVQFFSNKMTEKRNEVQKLQAELTKPTLAPQQKDQYEKDILRLQRELQDLDAQARKEIGKEQGDIAVQIFKEIEGVVQAVAAANGFDLVLSFPDSSSNQPDEMYSQDNVVRKMASQAAIPLFYKPHIDLTSAVVQTLNTRYPPAAATPTPPAGRPGG